MCPHLPVESGNQSALIKMCINLKSVWWLPRQWCLFDSVVPIVKIGGGGLSGVVFQELELGPLV